MPCPTCDYTMQGIGHHSFWCPRCGTLKAEDPGLGTDLVERPMLVDRCRNFQNNCPSMVNIAGRTYEAWNQLGIEASINLPAAHSPPT